MQISQGLALETAFSFNVNAPVEIFLLYTEIEEFPELPIYIFLSSLEIQIEKGENCNIATTSFSVKAPVEIFLSKTETVSVEKFTA